MSGHQGWFTAERRRKCGGPPGSLFGEPASEPEASNPLGEISTAIGSTPVFFALAAGHEPRGGRGGFVLGKFGHPQPYKTVRLGQGAGQQSRLWWGPFAIHSDHFQKQSNHESTSELPPVSLAHPDHACPADRRGHLGDRRNKIRHPRQGVRRRQGRRLAAAAGPGPDGLVQSHRQARYPERRQGGHARAREGTWSGQRAALR